MAERSMRRMARLLPLLPLLCLLAGAGRAGEGVRIVRDFEPAETGKRWPWPGQCAYGKPVKEKATHGEHALKLSVPRKLKRYCRVGPVAGLKAEPRQMAIPPNNDYHDTLQWYFERYCPIIDDAYSRVAHEPRDWSGYEKLRFDVLAVDAPLVLGMNVRDATGPRFRIGWTGMRSGTAVFNVPKGKWVTCEFPLAGMARYGEVDLKRMIGFYLHFNGYQGDTPYYLDYFRLVARGAEGTPKHEVIRPRGGITARFHKVVRTPPLERDPAKLERDLAPVGNLGPVTASKQGDFGGLGVTYYNTVRRGVVCYDSKRVLFISRRGGGMGSRKINPGSDTAAGVYAHATFDGGRTWGGITPAEKLPTHLNTWYGRAGASSDYETGGVYMIGTENCQSYHGGYDTFFRSLGFTGEKWAPERVSMIDGNMQKCPFWCHALRLKSGRIWAIWCDGRSTGKFPGCAGFPYKYSDDGGLTWRPCKSGDLEKVPRPLYKPEIKDIARAHEKAPSKLLLMPAQLTTGPMMAPFKGTLMAFSPNGAKYAVQEGEGFSRWKDVPAFGQSGRYAECTVTSVGGKDVFVSRGGNYGFDDYAKNIRRGRTTMEKLELAQQTDLAVARFGGGKWSHETLETGGVWESILTASGGSVFCFYVKVGRLDQKNKVWEVRYRRWKGGEWGPSVKLAGDEARINRLAAPRRCPPNCAVVLWDHIVRKGEPGGADIKFARVANK